MTTTSKRSTKPRRTSARRPLTPAEIERKEATYAERAETLHAELTSKVSQLVASDQWKAFLNFTASFHHYSLNNTLLILAQCPNATQVAGYDAWRKLGRKVNQRCSIRIYGRPFRTVKDKDAKTGEETKRRVACRPPILSVWDISQTEPIPGVAQPGELARRLSGEDHANIYDRAASVLTARGWDVSRQEIPGEKNGYTTLTGPQRVVVDSGLSPAQTAKTVIHELAHVVLHAEPFRAAEDAGAEVPPLHRGIWETEAESVAYVVAAMLGLDASDYSVGYVAGWADGNTELVAQTATRVHAAAVEIAKALDIDATNDSTANDDTGDEPVLAESAPQLAA
ncbi:ArdC-like ssDNA-binding domain-containing protein [Nocardia altamirensis]|uniref:ArdC-like ssDNA-binding domain-containing protein n=1 Tax=Nocardia altamirensis TaxID=472158 RepID=UPI0008408F27|nr:ArdC-like ssDNA-binding domain-containing protein [Nocardia altamirensis]